MNLTLEKYVYKTHELLEKERDAEIEETRILQENVPVKELQRRGVCLLKLRLASCHTGLYGRTVIALEPYLSGKDMPSHNFTPGDIAGLSISQSEGNKEMISSGIVSKVTQSSISIAFEDSMESLNVDDQTQYKLLKLANDVTYRRLKRALADLSSYHNGPCSQLISVLFGNSELSPPRSFERDGVRQELEFFNDNLDESQREAVTFALSQKELAIIHGPPGTGKTTTVIEIIRQAVSRKLKILACAPSNIAVDNLVERLVENTAKVVRLGHPARLLGNIQQYALDAIVASSAETQLVEDVRKEMNKTLSSIRKTRDKGDKQRLREDMKMLRKELRQREEAAISDILKRADVVMATLTTSSADGPLKYLDKTHFDLVIIDECSQALEAACWIALPWAPKCILAGDHNQLPPTILSQQAAKEGLEITLMERLLDLHGDTAMRMLTVQYRMHEDIMNWSSQQLYDNKLVAHVSVASHLLRDLSGLEDNENTNAALVLIDTSGCDLQELVLPDEVSKGNEGEADIVAHHVKALIDSGLSANDIAVIAPYNLQVDLLRLRMSASYPKLEIRSVDGFQGREKEAVIISLVRSNENGEVGFLAENRRINVAITRARRHLVVVCDTETVSHDDFLRSLVEYMTEAGEVRSAQQYIEDGVLRNDFKRPEYLEDQLQLPSAKTTKPEIEAGARPKTGGNFQKKQISKKIIGEKKPQESPREIMQRSKPQKREPTEEDITMEAELERTLQEFLHDKSRKSHAFPPSFNSRQRFLVHEISERLGLTHISKGEGENRHITVSRPTYPEAKPNTASRSACADAATKSVIALLGANIKDASQVLPGINKKKTVAKEQRATQQEVVIDKEEESDNEKKMQLDSEVSIMNCDKCGKEIPSANYALHKLQCNKFDRQGAAPKSAKSKKKNKQKRCKEGPSLQGPPEDVEDFEELISQAIKENTQCHVGKCKNNAATLGQNCEFCAQRFCLTHCIAEAHGCGERAREKARAQLSRDGVLYRGSGVPDRKPSATKRAHLSRKLENKITDMADKRKTKKKEK